MITDQDARPAVPDHVPAELVREWDYTTDPKFADRPFETLDGMRDQRTFWSRALGGFWVLTRSEDIRYVYQHPGIFSSHPIGIPPLQGYPRKLIPEELDPPEHGKYRHVLSEPFSPGAIAAMADEVETVCTDLVDGLVDDDGCEFLDAFARPYPSTIFTKMLGLPLEETAKFIQWTADLLHEFDPEVRQAAGANCVGYLSQVIEDRAAEPRQDLVSHLLASRVDHRPLTHEEVLDTCFLLFIAGLDTVTLSLAFIFRHLAENADLRRRLAGDPSLIPPAIEELLRAHAFVSPGRYVTRDVEIAGVTMKAGDPVLVSTAMASRDPDEFADPAAIDIERSPNRHIAFGAGPHRCLGSHLARRELTVALTEWLARIPDFWIPEDAVIRGHGGSMAGIDRLPLAWR